MGKHTIDLPAGTDNRLLARHVAPYNILTAKDLTLDDWITLHLNELAINDELAAVAGTLQAQAQRNHDDALTSAINAERDRLLTELTTPSVRSPAP